MIESKDYDSIIGYGDEGKAAHVAKLNDHIRELKKRGAIRNKLQEHIGHTRPHLLRLPEGLLHKNEKPYPYILGGQYRDEDN